MAVDRAGRVGVRARSSVPFWLALLIWSRRPVAARRSRLATRASRSRVSARPAGATSPRGRSR